MRERAPVHECQLAPARARQAAMRANRPWVGVVVFEVELVIGGVDDGFDPPAELRRSCRSGAFVRADVSDAAEEFFGDTAFTEPGSARHQRTGIPAWNP